MHIQELYHSIATDKKKLAAAAAGVVFIAVILAVSLKRPPADDTVREKEFIAGRAMQIYIHNRGNDAILRSSDPVFGDISDTAALLLSSIEEAVPAAGEWIEIGPDGLPPGDERPGNVVEDLKDNDVSVSVWYLDPARFSTSIPAAAGQSADSQGYLVLTADRVLVLLGGPYRGLVLLRSDNSTNRYYAYRPSNEVLRYMVEAVRTSASMAPAEEAPLPDGLDLEGPEDINPTNEG